jgi:heptosyltransferase-2
LGSTDDSLGLEIWLSEETAGKKYPPHERRIPLQIRKVAIAPGAHHFTKRLPEETFVSAMIKMFEKYNCSFALIGGTADMEICSRIAQAIKTQATPQQAVLPQVEIRAGGQSIEETARIVNDCDLILTNDTGVMHIAAARMVPIVAIFGSTVTDFGFAPYRAPAEIVEMDIPCRPCTHIGRSSCPKGHFDCMKRITADMIMEAVAKVMKQ